jgi:two-component system OmpR family response regulator
MTRVAGSLHILVVDDEPDIRLVVRAVLEGYDWEVEEAESGEEALERCRNDSPSVVVLDQRMPGLSGIEVARALRAEGSNVPIVIFTAFAGTDFEAEAAELGVPTVAKSDFDGLIDRVRELAG